MNDNEITLNDLILSYKELNLNDKRKEFGRELAETTIVIQKLVNDLAGNAIPVNIDEFDNLLDGQSSEDEYLAGLYEDFLNFKELLGVYLSKTSELYYESNNQ